MNIQDRRTLTIIVSLTTAGLVALIVVLGWIFPPLAEIYPASWSLMQSSTAFGILMLICGLSLNYRVSKGRLAPPGWAFAVSAMLLGCLAVVEHAAHQETGIGKFVVAEAHLSITHPMSIQSALSLILIGITMLIKHTSSGAAGRAFDLILYLLCAMMLVFALAYLFDLSSLVGHSDMIRISPQTLLCLVLLILVQFIRRKAL